MNKTLDQKRAEHAWKEIEKVKKGGDRAKQYGTQAKKLPARIMASGLGQALAFLLAKSHGEGDKKQGMRDLLDTLSVWADTQRKAKPAEDPRLLVRLIHGDADFQRWATAESLAYLQWLVRFADAEGLTREADGD